MRHRNATLFVTVSLVAGFGSTAMSLVAGVWAMDLTGSVSLAGLAGLCVFAPMLAGPVLGAAVDRLPRRPLVVGTNLAMAVLLLSLVGVRGPGQVWLLFAVMVAYGVTHVLVDAGEAAILPAALPLDAIGPLNGLRMSVQEGTKLLAPLVGAGLFALIGGFAVAALSAGLLAVAAALYAQLQLTEAPKVHRGRQRIRDGIGYLWTHPALLMVVLVGSTAMFMSGVGTGLNYALIDEGLHRPAAFAGVLASVQGVGSILGGVLAGRILDRRGEAYLGGWGAILFGLGVAIRCIPWLPGVVAGGVLIGVGLPWAVVAAMTAVQVRTPSELLGRVAGTSTTLVFAPVAFAIPIGAGVLTFVDYRVPMAVSAVATLAVGSYALSRRSREQRSAVASTAQ